MQPILALDCDGVLCDFETAARKIVTEVAGSDDGVNGGAVFDHLDEDAQRRCRIMVSERGWCRNLEPYAVALKHWPALIRRFDIHILTSPYRSETWCHEREEWLAKHFGIDRDNVHFSSKKHMFHSDLFIDDNLQNVLVWSRRWRNSVGVVWHKPYNDHGPVGTFRTDSWEKIIDVNLGSPFPLDRY
jgi:5'(3')-deoxyribonucleotidase